MSAEIHTVSTNITCTVSSGAGHLSAEVDQRPWGYNGGKTQFFAGDNCYVIVYISASVTIKNSYITNASFFSKYDSKSGTGNNIKREGITFNSPIASAPLPISGTPSVLSSTYIKCSTPQYQSGTTNLRMKTWTPDSPPDPTKDMPWGYVFIEYTPTSQMWQIGGLTPITGMINTPVVGSLFGIYSATTIAFTSLA